MCLLAMKKNKGIILKKLHKNRERVSLLDSQLGKLEVSFNRFLPGYGVLLEYTIIKTVFAGRVNYALDSIEFIAIPTKCYPQKLHFFHQVLEICYYFIPLENPIPGVFDLLFLLYDEQKWATKHFFEELFICKLFMILGFFPEEPQFLTQSFMRLAELPIDTVLDEHVDLERSKEMRMWINACLQTHPQAKKFKIMHNIQQV